MKTLLLPKNLQGKYKRMMKGKSIIEKKDEKKDEDIVMTETIKNDPINELTTSFKSLNPSRKPLKYKI